MFSEQPGRRALTAAALLRSHKAQLRSMGLILDTEVDRVTSRIRSCVSRDRSPQRPAACNCMSRVHSAMRLRATRRLLLQPGVRLYMRSPGLRLRCMKPLRLRWWW